MNYSFAITGMIVTGLMSGCGHSPHSMKPEETLFEKGELLINGYFTGKAYLKPLLAKDKNNEFSIGSVHFEAGARTHWHTHPKGQVLLITQGEGLYQEKGKAARVIQKGDVINIPEDVEHWHGATATQSMTHIAITNVQNDRSVEWLQPVSKEDYTAAQQ